MQFLFHLVLCLDMHQPQRMGISRKSEYVGSSFWAVFLTYKFWRSVSWSCNSPISADPDSVGLRCELSGSKYSACCKQLSYKATSTMLTGTKNMLDKFLHNTSWSIIPQGWHTSKLQDMARHSFQKRAWHSHGKIARPCPTHQKRRAGLCGPVRIKQWDDFCPNEKQSAKW